MLSTQGKLLLALIQYIQAEITKFLDISLSLWMDFFLQSTLSLLMWPFAISAFM